MDTRTACVAKTRTAESGNVAVSVVDLYTLKKLTASVDRFPVTGFTCVPDDNNSRMWI